MTLTDFLLDRIAEDEAVARAAEALAWHTLIHVMYEGRVEDADNEVVVYESAAPTGEQATHIARHDPARVLAECEAKRRIVHEFTVEVARGPAGTRPEFEARHEGILDAYRAALRLLAQPYADHTDFDPAWAV